jgi:hypothetical protein
MTERTWFRHIFPYQKHVQNEGASLWLDDFSVASPERPEPAQPVVSSKKRVVAGRPDSDCERAAACVRYSGLSVPCYRLKRCVATPLQLLV